MPPRFRVAYPREHVRTPQEWGYKAGTDFWLVAAASGMLTATNAHELADYGWTTTALSFAAPSGADFMASADVGVPNAIDFGASGDLLKSPSIFGDYAHSLMAQQLLKKAPTKLILEAYAQFSVATANEPTSGFGFVEDIGTPATAADHMAFISTNGTNFLCASGAANDVGALDDSLFHLWKVVLNKTTALVEWFIDGVSQGTLAVQNDLFPASFGAHVLTTNRLQLAWAHVYYDY